MIGQAQFDLILLFKPSLYHSHHHSSHIIIPYYSKLILFQLAHSYFLFGFYFLFSWVDFQHTTQMAILSISLLLF